MPATVGVKVLPVPIKLPPLGASYQLMAVFGAGLAVNVGIASPAQIVSFGLTAVGATGVTHPQFCTVTVVVAVAEQVLLSVAVTV